MIESHRKESQTRDAKGAKKDSASNHQGTKTQRKTTERVSRTGSQTRGAKTQRTLDSNRVGNDRENAGIKEREILRCASE
jgi:hypothetical protein